MNTPTETQELVRKAGKNFDYERAANVLFGCLLNGVKQAAKDFGVSERTVSNYKVRLAKDPYLAHLYLQRKNAYDAELSTRLTKACNGCLDFIERATQSADLSPEMLHSVVGALKITSSVKTMDRLLNEKLNKLEQIDQSETFHNIAGMEKALDAPQWSSNRNNSSI